MKNAQGGVKAKTKMGLAQKKEKKKKKGCQQRSKGVALGSTYALLREAQFLSLTPYGGVRK